MADQAQVILGEQATEWSERDRYHSHVSMENMKLELAQLSIKTENKAKPQAHCTENRVVLNFLWEKIESAHFLNCVIILLMLINGHCPIYRKNSKNVA